MKKIVVSVITVISLLMLLISCTQFVPLTPEQIRERIVQAETAMSEGEDAVAQSLFEEVLKSDPDNGEANMGMGMIMSMRSQKSILNMVADYFTVQSISELRAMHKQPVKNLARGLMTARNMVNRISTIDFQMIQSRAAVIVDQLEDAKESLEIAINNMSDEASMTVYPNAFDWNEDGFVDSEQPLNFVFDVEGESRVWWLLFYNEPEEFLSSAAQRGFFDDTIRGDAWFDKETVEFLMENGMVPEGYEPTFNEEDHITLDATGAKVLLALVNLELTLFEPFIIWDIDPNPELTDFLEDFRDSDNPINFATSTLDADANGTITNTEFRTVLPENFLAFYDDDNGGANAITDWKAAIVDFCTLALEIGEMGLFEIPLAIDEPLERIINLLTDPTEKVELSEGVFFVPYNFFNVPDNFADLKDFIPDVGYDPFLNPSFPDPTFGELIEGLE